MNPYARILFEINAVVLSPGAPFTYASGLKGPIYCDNRTLLTHVLEREKIIAGLVAEANIINFDCLAGLATAGIPHASMMAVSMKKPMCYVRSKPKEHGKGNQVEGSPAPQSKLLLIEDLVNQGSSLKDAVLGVRRSGFAVDRCLAIVNYETTKAKEVLQELNVNLSALVTFTDLINCAQELGRISSADILTLKEWQLDPVKWSESRSEKSHS